MASRWRLNAKPSNECCKRRKAIKWVMLYWKIVFLCFLQSTVFALWEIQKYAEKDPKPRLQSWHIKECAIYSSRIVQNLNSFPRHDSNAEIKTLFASSLHVSERQQKLKETGKNTPFSFFFFCISQCLFIEYTPALKCSINILSVKPPCKTSDSWNSTIHTESWIWHPFVNKRERSHL